MERVPGVNFDPRGAKHINRLNLTNHILPNPHQHGGLFLHALNIGTPHDFKVSTGVKYDPRTYVGVKIDPRDPFT